MPPLKRPKMAGNKNAKKDNPLDSVIKIRVSRKQFDWLKNSGDVSKLIRGLIEKEMNR